jgi:hypothetical protein
MGGFFINQNHTKTQARPFFLFFKAADAAMAEGLNVGVKDGR